MRKNDTSSSATPFVISLNRKCTIFGIQIRINETTAMRAAYFSGLAVRFWKDIDEIEKLWKLKKKFVPKSDPQAHERIAREWKKAVKRVDFRYK